MVYLVLFETSVVDGASHEFVEVFRSMRVAFVFVVDYAAKFLSVGRSPFHNLFVFIPFFSATR